MEFNVAAYGPEVQAILTSTGDGLSRLVASAAPTPKLKDSISLDLFAKSAHPAGALSGLWLYFDCFEQAHTVAQDDKSREGSFWHAIAHRREPDYWNSSYWFRQVGSHPSYPAILEAAKRLSEATPDARLLMGEESKWNPDAFVEFCEEAAKTGGEQEQFALRMQRAEWQILFDYCAAEKRSV
ncbi:MAG TPA: hypothetical protein VGL53_31055 [Bryobacteraceae bacterium]|jgi:hypothetical protein